MENLKFDNYDSGDLNSFLSDGDGDDDTTEMNKKVLHSAMMNGMDKTSTAKIDTPSQHNQDSSDDDDTAHVEILADEDYESD